MLFWFRVLHVLFDVPDVVVEDATDRVTRADEADVDTSIFLFLLQTDLLLILGLLEYLPGQNLSSSNQANAIFSLKW